MFNAMFEGFSRSEEETPNESTNEALGLILSQMQWSGINLLRFIAFVRVMGDESSPTSDKSEEN